MKTGTRIELITGAIFNCYDMLMAEAVKSENDNETRVKLMMVARNLLMQRDELRKIGEDMQ